MSAGERGAGARDEMMPFARHVGTVCPDCGLTQGDATHDSATDCIRALRASNELRRKFLDFARDREAKAQVAREDAEREAAALRQQLAAAEGERGALFEERDRLRQTVFFFASVIRSGERWTEECDKALAQATAPLRGAAATPDGAARGGAE